MIAMREFCAHCVNCVHARATEELVRRSIMVMPNLHEFRWAYDAGEVGPARLSDAFVRTLLTRTTLKKLTIP